MQTIKNYIQIYKEEEQKLHKGPHNYTDEQIKQFVENRVSDNYVNPSDMVKKMNMFIVILFIEKHKLIENPENKQRLTEYVSDFWTGLNTKIQKRDTDNLADTMINDFSDLTGFRTNYKPLLRLRSLLKHYIQSHNIQTQPHNYSSEEFQVDMARYAIDAWYRYVISHGGTRPTKPHRNPSRKKRTPYKALPKRRVRSSRRRRTSTRKR